MKKSTIKKITAIAIAAAMMSAGTYMAFASEEDIDVQMIDEDVAAADTEAQETEPTVEPTEEAQADVQVEEDTTDITADDAEVSSEVAADEEEIAVEDETANDTEETKQIKTDFSFENDEVVITAKVSEEAALPENAEMKVIKLEAGSEKYEEAKQASIKDLGGAEDDEYVFYDVTFTVNGTEVELADGAAVINMQFKSADMTANDDTQCIHIDETESGAVAQDVTAQTEDGTVKSVDFAM